MKIEVTIRELVEKMKNFLIRRKQAYEHVFLSESIYTEIVLRDLAKFCRAHDSTFHKDDRASALLEGRREVWLRISQHLNLSDEALWDLYGKKEG